MGALVGPHNLSVLLEYDAGSMRQQARRGAVGTCRRRLNPMTTERSPPSKTGDELLPGPPAEAQEALERALSTLDPSAVKIRSRLLTSLAAARTSSEVRLKRRAAWLSSRCRSPPPRRRSPAFKASTSYARTLSPGATPSPSDNSMSSSPASLKTHSNYARLRDSRCTASFMRGSSRVV